MQDTEVVKYFLNFATITMKYSVCEASLYLIHSHPTSRFIDLI